MRRRVFDLFGETGKIDDISSILKRSNPATCGIMERKINVKAENVDKVKRALKAKGFVIIGTSEKGTRMRKVWFIRAGGI